MIRPFSRSALTLIEVIAAIVLISAVAFMGMRHVKTAGESSHSKACELSRQTIQNEVDRYRRLNGRLPSANLREIESAAYWDGQLPVCPNTQSVYTIDRTGTVVCRAHR